MKLINFCLRFFFNFGFVIFFFVSEFWYRRVCMGVIGRWLVFLEDNKISVWLIKFINRYKVCD